MCLCLCKHVSIVCKQLKSIFHHRKCGTLISEHHEYLKIHTDTWILHAYMCGSIYALCIYNNIYNTITMCMLHIYITFHITQCGANIMCAAIVLLSHIHMHLQDNRYKGMHFTHMPQFLYDPARMCKNIC